MTTDQATLAPHGLAAAARLRVFGKSPVGVGLRLGEGAWRALPTAMTASAPAVRVGRAVNALVRAHAERTQFLGTYFFRNRPQLDLIRDLVRGRENGSTLRLAVLACSLGAEVYSVAWSIRSARPDLALQINAVDISAEAIESARCGVYPLGVSALARESLCERMSWTEIDGMFDRVPDGLRVKPWLREGIEWHVGDVCDGRLVAALGRHDVVLANDFLCHMRPPEAESCLRALAPFVAPAGHLVVSGVDLDVRAVVARDLGWKPLTARREAIHEGDPSLRRAWPWKYWGLEPLDAGRTDADTRYSTVFQIGGAS